MPSSFLTFTLSTSLFFAARAYSQTETEPPKSPSERAWALLDDGSASDSAETRRIAVGALGVVIKNPHAIQIAEKALKDDKPEVRAAAASALGKMQSRSSIPKLISVLDDKEPEVVLAAAQSLVSFRNEQGYDVYYEVLTGQRKGGKGAVGKELESLKNPKKLAEMGFEEGIGFVPFGGMGLEAFRVLTGGNTSAVRAAAAKVLAHDPDPSAGNALSDAIGDNSWHVRVAAIDAIAERGDPKLISAVLPGLDDDKDAVKYSAAAAVVRLTNVKHGKEPKVTKTAVGARD